MQQQQQQTMVPSMHMPPHPSAFSNPSIYKSMLPTISPQSIAATQVPQAQPQFHSMVGNGQQGQILIYDKNANGNPSLQQLQVHSPGMHRSSSLTLSHQSSTGSLTGFHQPNNLNNGLGSTQVQHMQNINNLHIQQQQQRNQQ